MNDDGGGTVPVGDGGTAAPSPGALPSPEVIDGFMRFVPLLEAWYRRAPEEMPRELAEAFERNRLTGRHGSVLSQLVHGQEPTVSELVGDLAYAGLVTRRKDPANRRRVLVALSEEYRPLMERFAASRAAPLLRVIDRLSPEARRGFAEGLRARAEEVTPSE